jgi:hypothetical protein
VDSTYGTSIHVELQPPEGLVGDAPKPFRPTGFMERISVALEGLADGESLTINALVKQSDWVPGKAPAKRAPGLARWA